MTRLLAELLKDPGCSFEIEADLPSGTLLRGTVGPIINGRLCANLQLVRLDGGDATAEDMRYAKEALDFMVGTPPEYVSEARTPEEKLATLKTMRKFMGGGQG